MLWKISDLQTLVFTIGTRSDVIRESFHAYKYIKKKTASKIKKLVTMIISNVITIITLWSNRISFASIDSRIRNIAVVDRAFVSISYYKRF